MTDKPSIAIMASGAGTNAQAILRYAQKHGTFTVGLIVSNNSKAGVRDVAVEYDVPFLHVSTVTHPEAGERDRFLLESFAQSRVSLIALAGFLKPVSPAIISAYADRIINIHPSLLPKYGGQGMFGMLVHEKVLQNRELFSGISVHIVGANYDDGRVLAQASLKLSPEENAYDLSKRIRVLEHAVYPALIDAILRTI